MLGKINEREKRQNRKRGWKRVRYLKYCETTAHHWYGYFKSGKRKKGNNKRWPGYGNIGNVVNSWWGYKMV